jgi:ketosteroid isomerase-like protein
MRAFWLLVALVPAALGLHPVDRGPVAPPDSNLNSLVAAELAFAAHASRAGIRSAFLEYLVPGAVMFAPGPVDGYALFEGRPESKGVLTWYPTAAGVSYAGDLGYSTGPSEFRSSPSDTAVHHGHYSSMWRRSADGVWKVELDLGTPNPRPRGRIAPFDTSTSVPPPPRRFPSLNEREIAALTDTLVGLDSAFARTSAALGTAAAMDQLVDPQARVHRAGEHPAIGRNRAMAVVRREPGKPHWEPAGGGAARSGDLGYTWGAVRWTAEGGDVATGYYLRVWRRGPQGWRVVLDAVTPRDES